MSQEIQEVDVAIIGGGPGGYVAAIRAAQLGLKAALVEKEKLGGICLHKGCIPTKTLLRSAEIYHEAKEGRKYGILMDALSIDFAQVQRRKEEIVEQLHKGIQFLLKKGKISVYEGYGRILGPSIFSPQAGAVSITKENGESEIVYPRHVIIATGSRPRLLPGLPFDGEKVMTSDEALMMQKLPKSILIVGGGVIGVEWASLLSDFGVEVTIVESMDRILPFEDEEISKEMTRIFKKRKVNILTKVKLLPETVNLEGDGVTAKGIQEGKEIEFHAEKMLVSVGRAANVEDIGLENTSIEVDQGVIKVNSFYQTKEPHIYAIGDCIGGLQLAHVASHEGIVAVEHIAGLHPDPINYAHVPKCTYSRPQVASVGLTEKEAIERGHRVKTGKVQFRAIGKALIKGEPDGFAKIVMDEKTKDLLGVHLIGPEVTELISESALGLFLNATPWEIHHSIHPHPTLSEIMAEAAMAIEGESIHG
ncbi:dihydrolipoyl dehydrogenase [Thermicanus aegyptius]|uniref:dihydrolipoyl dehydrogenase n=1 Tax=Thermicanus aegyptius TaxID=94009 RepID=UPI00041DC30A|nr:dihydrolipoyl dehydrogenase [Thermicanus aegyptius]